MSTNKKSFPVRALTTALSGLFLLFALGAESQTYCAPAMINAPQYEYISNVTFAGINNNSGTGSSTPVNFTALVATVVPGSSYGFSVTGMTPNNNFPEWYKVWIDWNKNGVLNDAGEFYDLGYSGILPWVATTVITVPANALQGVTRMRVMMAGNSTGNTTNYAGSNPCYSSVGYGEVEDYSIDVRGACSGVITPTLTLPGTATVCQGLPVAINVTGATSSLGVTYQWQQSTVSGGPYTSSAPASSVLATQIPTVANGITYYVLVATCSSTLASATATSNQIAITGSAVPVAPVVSASPAISCVGSSVTLNSQSSAGATYSWTGPAFSSTLQNPGMNNVLATASGNYSVIARQYNCTSPQSVVSITVSPNPTLAISASQPQFCIGGAPVTLSVATNGNTSYFWSTGANTQTAAVSPSVTMPYNVIVQNSYSCFAQAVYTMTAIDATLSVLGAWSCNNGPGGSGILTAQAFTPSTVSWYADATGTTTPMASASANSLGIATYTINNSYADSTIYVQAKFGVCPSPLMPITLTVSPQPTISISSFPTLNTAVQTITVCSNDHYTFTALGAANYTWNNGQSSAPTNTFLIIPSTYTFFSNANNYTISATSTDGCTNSKQISLYVNPSPVVSASSYTNNICPGGTVSLLAFGNAQTYTWSANANNSSAPTIVVSPTVNGIYTVIGTAVNGCTTAASQTISINAAPALTLTSKSPTICAGESVSITAGGAVTYTWVSSNFQLQGPVAFVNPNITTDYQVTGTGTNGCVNTATLQQVVRSCIGIEQLSGMNGMVKVYPNPNNGAFTVELANGAQKTMELIDLAGRIVMTSTSGEDAVIINISQLASSVYYLKVRSNNALEVIKVVKQ